MEFTNVYQDIERADSYSKLEFPGTYYLAFRDLPVILSRYVNGYKALDFGCGAGRSTRFLRKFGFETKGVDISPGMLKKANEIEPGGDYQLIKNGELTHIQSDNYNLILSAFTFDNIPTFDLKLSLFNEFRRVLKSGGIVINLVSSPELYQNEWASFSTKDFPGNFIARCGDKVYTIMLDVEDQRPVEDVFWPDEQYKKVYQCSELELLETFRPIGYESEPFKWINETRIAPWVIYVLRN